MKFPCKKCISFAICVHQDEVVCELLYDYLKARKGRQICYSLSVFNCGAYRKWDSTTSRNKHRIEFIRDKKEIDKILSDYVVYNEKPKIVKYVVLFKYWMYGIIIPLIIRFVALRMSLDEVQSLNKGMKKVKGWFNGRKVPM